MVTEHAIPDPPEVATAFELLLSSIGRWLVDNPPWTVGIVAVLALLLWYFLHIRPAKKSDERLMQSMVIQANKEAEDRQAKQQYRDKKHREELKVTALREEERAAIAAKADKENTERAQAEQAAKDKAGTDFELRIMALLKKEFADWLETGRAKLLHDVTFPAGKQIDILFIDTSGIYVIECKCWNGFFVGKYDWKYWMVISCKLSNGFPCVVRNDEPFYCKAIESPLSQNKEQSRALRCFLNDTLHKIYKQYKRISVFDTCGSVDFVIRPETVPGDYYSQYTWLGKKDELTAAIRNYDKDIPEVSRLSAQDVDMIYDTLKPYAKNV